MDASNHQPTKRKGTKVTVSNNVKIPRQWGTKPVIRPDATVPYCVEGSGSNPTWEMGIELKKLHSPILSWGTWRVYFAVAAILGDEPRGVITFRAICDALGMTYSVINYEMIRQSLRSLHSFWVRRVVDEEKAIESPLLCVSEMHSQKINNVDTPHQFEAEIPRAFREILKRGLITIKFENIKNIKSRHAASLLFFLPAWAAKCGKDKPCVIPLRKVGEILELPNVLPGRVRDALTKNAPRSVIGLLNGVMMAGGCLRLDLDNKNLRVWKEYAPPSDGKIKRAYRAGGGDAEKYAGYITAGRGLSPELEKRIYALGVPPRYHKFLDICSRLLSFDPAIMPGIVQIAGKDHKARYKVRNPGALFATRLLNVVKALPKAKNSKFWQDAAACKEQKEAKKNDAKKGNR